MLPDRVSNPGPLTYESGALPIALRGPALKYGNIHCWSGKGIAWFSFKYDTKENDDALEQSLVSRAPPDEVGGAH